LETERDEKRFEKGKCPLCSESEDSIPILSKFSEMGKWREQFLRTKQLTINEEVAYIIE
jgi:hypothetical protein